MKRTIGLLWMLAACGTADLARPPPASDAHTADTGRGAAVTDGLEDVLTGVVPAHRIGRLPDFHCRDVDGVWRGADDLYDGRRTVLHLTAVDPHDGSVDDDLVLPALDALAPAWARHGAKAVVISTTDATALGAAKQLYGLDLPLWRDGGVVTGWYLQHTAVSEALPLSLLVDADGEVLLVYPPDEVRTDASQQAREAHPAEVLVDLEILAATR